MTAEPKPGFAKVFSISEAAKQAANGQQGTQVMTIVTPFDRDGDETSYKWSEIRDRLSLSSNVANARWMPKLMALFGDLEASPALLTDTGKPTKFAAQMLGRYKRFCVDDERDYEMFCSAVREAFSTPAKEVVVEVLSPNDGSGNSDDDSSSPFAAKEEAIAEKEDSLASRITLALQSKQQASQAIAKYENLSQKSWEQQIIEDEIAKYQEEQDRKKKEAELRLKVREMLEKGGLAEQV